MSGTEMDALQKGPAASASELLGSHTPTLFQLLVQWAGRCCGFSPSRAGGLFISCVPRDRPALPTILMRSTRCVSPPPACT